MEPDYDKDSEIIVTPSINIESEPALIMLRHMWQSIQELKRRQIEEEIPSFGQGVAQQLEVLRKLNRRQTQKKKIIDLLNDSKTLDNVLQKAFENVDNFFPTESNDQSNFNNSNNFPSRNEEMDEYEKIEK
uniref:Uncharacterized protein n=1 Tax=Panagrolaimus sp. JU765 TaxID=591449 RepID=A0AC34RHC9_9BILA